MRIGDYAFQNCTGLHTLECPDSVTYYGKYMIQQSGPFAYDPNLEEIYDYERCGLQRMEQEYGMFTDCGYISYHGTLSLEELMAEDPAETYRQEQGFRMGGMA